MIFKVAVAKELIERALTAGFVNEGQITTEGIPADATLETVKYEPETSTVWVFFSDYKEPIGFVTEVIPTFEEINDITFSHE